MKQAQLEFTTILNEAFQQYEKRIVAYALLNKAKYESFARAVTPERYDNAEIYSRVAFAILSANSPFEDSVKALRVAVEKQGKVRARDIARYKQVPAKAAFVNALARSDLQALRKSNSEDWHGYRLRLRAIKGLGLTKASFAACLLYPLEADLACVDTWIQKVFLGHEGFRDLSLIDYLTVESKIRTYARCWQVSTFLAQWLIWDHARGRIASHAIFPGAHKGKI